MRIFITGAAGFIGSALANKMVKEGHYVRGLDDLSTGDPDRLLPDVEFIRGDINDRPKLWTLLQDVDCVYHVAARVVVPESVLYPREYNLVNVGGTVTLMEAMRDVGVRRVVFTSSGAIYGNQSSQPVKESAIPQPRSPYAVSKLSAEYYIHTIGGLWGIETVNLRIFNAYGPGQQMPPTHPPVIPYFLKQAHSNSTLVVHGDGIQTRDYIYIDDVVNGLMTASSASGINRETINLGSGRETSVRELTRLVAEITGKSPEVVYNTRNDGGPSRMCADLSLAREKLNFYPLTPLEIGLQNTYESDLRLRIKNTQTG
ncbi:MAG: NAD-dependent epimerase/dehydratase family protein [Anaerolineaceae bacterium]|nr:NAD-dependent epimerase/dehydratase family protein [Anaerolineaceae bacterium]